MPIVRITLKTGKSPEYLSAVSDSIYAAMREHYLLDEGDLFHIFEQLDSDAFIFDRNYGVAEPRTDDFMIIQIDSDPRRIFEKIATMKSINDKLVESLDIKPQDVVVMLHPTLAIDEASLGNGVSTHTLVS